MSLKVLTSILKKRKELAHPRGMGKEFSQYGCSSIDLKLEHYVYGSGECLLACPVQLFETLCSPPGFSVHGILQARILEWVSVPSSRGSS